MSIATNTVFRSSFANRKITSENNLHDLDELPLSESERAQIQLESLKIRKNALEETLEKKLNELKQICLKEGELIGYLPKEYPLNENEEPPVIRRRIKTAYTFSDRVFMKPKGKEDDKLTKLELEFDINCKIVKATNLLYNDPNIKKAIRKQRKNNHLQAVAKLKDIEKNLQATRKLVEDEEKARRAKNLKSLENCNDKLSSNDSNLNSFLNNQNQINKDLALLTSLQPSLPPTPVKLRRNKNFSNEQDQAINPHIENLIKQRINNQSPEYDTISTAASSLDSANNLFIHKKLIHNGNIAFNNYEELFENSPETEAKKLFGVPTRRSAIAPNLSHDNSLLNKKQQNSSPNLFYPASSLDKCGALDKFRKPDALKGLENLESNFRITGSTNQLSSSSSLLSPNQLQANQFNFGSSSSFNQKMNNNSAINKSQTLCNVNMASRPLPSPPVEHKKNQGNQKQQSSSTTSNKPAPLNLANQNDLLIKSNPIKSPSIVSMFQQSPLDFEKATSLYLNKQQQQTTASPKECENLNQQHHHHQISNNHHIRDTIVRATPAALTINTNDLNFNQLQQHHSPVPLLPPRTPITNKPNILNSLNPNSLNSISSLTLNSINPNSNMHSHQSNSTRNLIASNPNLNHASTIGMNQISNSNKYLNEKKKSKGWTETCIDTFVMPNNYKRTSDGYTVNKTNGDLNAFNKYHLREKENQFNSNLNNFNNNTTKLLSNRHQSQHLQQHQHQQPNYQPNNFNQFIKQDSKSSLTSNSSSNSNSTLLSNSSTQIFQPFVEEIKPYELSDFYKYSQKFKNAQKKAEPNNKEPDAHQQPTELFDNSLTPIKNESSEQAVQTNSQTNLQPNSQEDSFISKNQVVDGFKDDLIKWMNDKYDLNKSATLV